MNDLSELSIKDIENLRKQFLSELETELFELIKKHNKSFNTINQEITLRINITPITKI